MNENQSVVTRRLKQVSSAVNYGIYHLYLVPGGIFLLSAALLSPDKIYQTIKTIEGQEQVMFSSPDTAATWGAEPLIPPPLPEFSDAGNDTAVTSQSAPVPEKTGSRLNSIFAQIWLFLAALSVCLDRLFKSFKI